MNHTLRMIIGCTLPLLLIFFLPLIGVNEGATLFVAIVLMFGCHLMMMGGGHGHGSRNHSDERGEHHEHHIER